jgi:hypothetical protein
MKQINIMIDIETLGVKENSVILSIGACVVNKEKLTFSAQHDITFYKTVDITTQPNRTINQDTIDFWDISSNSKAKKEAFSGKCDLKDTLKELYNFIHQFYSPVLWCKGSDFDFVILRHAYAQLELLVPWQYNAIRDLRTLVKAFPQALSKDINKNPHNALEDAIFQARQLEAINSYLESKGIESIL